MRLLRADGNDLVLEPVEDESKKYAILSHRWLPEQEEVTYADLANGATKELAQSKEGYKKLDWCRQQAVRDGYQHIWADTVCIDKSSSQELTESINSMYRWYAKAQCCYVYLNDMPDLEQNAQHEAGGGNVGNVPKSYDQAAFRSCVWFTRAWTLQEMIAPTTVRFYTSSWSPIGELQDMASEISSITGVHAEILTKQRSLSSYSIAQRMSWAAGRSATKVEDRAVCKYSLLGIMDVAIGIIYGEGEYAFQRLQHELMRTSSDDSIFAFDISMRQVDFQGNSTTSLLADSPEPFKDCGNICLAKRRNQGNQYQMVSKEINFRARILAEKSSSSWWFPSKWRKAIHGKQETISKRKAILQCSVEGQPSKLIALNLFALPEQPDIFYVDAGGDRTTKISMFDEGHELCQWTNFSVIGNPDEAAKPLTTQDSTIFCQCKVADATLRFIGASQICTWLAGETTIVIPGINFDFEAELEISKDVTNSLRMQITRAKGLNSQIEVGFRPRAIRLPTWTTFIKREPYHCAIARFQGKFLIAKAFSEKSFLGYQSVPFVTVEQIKLAQLIWFMVHRMILILGLYLISLLVLYVAAVIGQFALPVWPLLAIAMVISHNISWWGFLLMFGGWAPALGVVALILTGGGGTFYNDW